MFVHTICKMLEQVFKCFRQNFGPLLNKSGGSSDVGMKTKEIHNFSI